jgi:hypothetical protein
LDANFTVHPSSATLPCLAGFGGGGFPIDTGIPAAAGHYNLNGLFGLPGELQLQVTQVKSS